MSAPETYTEDTPLDLTDIVVSDADSPNVTVTLTLSDPTAGSLSTGTSGAVTSTYMPAGVWTASGAIADVNTLLAGVTFTPALNYNSNFTIATSVDDGTAAPITGVKNMTGTPVNDAPTGSVTISGTPTEDQTLTASNTLGDADGMGVVSYQWQRDGVDIAGATNPTYTLTDADVGQDHYRRCRLHRRPGHERIGEQCGGGSCGQRERCAGGRADDHGHGDRGSGADCRHLGHQ